MRTLLLALLGLSPVVGAADRPPDYLYMAPLQIEAEGSHYRFRLPSAVYRASRRDLSDVRVFNAAGEPVPYAFAPRELQPVPAAVHPVRLFPLLGDREKGLASATVRVERGRQGAVVNVTVSDAVPAARRRLIGYLLDASDLGAPQEALLLAWESREGFSGSARVEGSDDLKHWRPAAANAPILLLQHGGARLERNRIELAGIRSKYLRVSFDGVPADFRLRAARIELRPEKAQPVREWLELAAAPGKASGELLVDTQGHFPIDRVRLSLPQPNTVAQVQLSTRERAEDRWRPAGSAIAYRLSPGASGGELTSPDMVVGTNADRYWRLEVDQRGGGFGAGEVRVALGWVPHEAVFAARGAPPFKLSYGNSLARPGALAVSAVVPGWGTEKAPPVETANVGPVSGSGHAAPSLLRDPVAFVRGFAEDRRLKMWTLWAALSGGVVLLGWMALRLLRDLGKAPGLRKNS